MIGGFTAAVAAWTLPGGFSGGISKGTEEVLVGMGVDQTTSALP